MRRSARCQARTAPLTAGALPDWPAVCNYHPQDGTDLNTDGVTMSTIIWVVALLIVAYMLLRTVPDIARYIRMRRM
jgi:hypothetical protein